MLLGERSDGEGWSGVAGLLVVGGQSRLQNTPSEGQSRTGCATRRREPFR
jgi:hypothetical protein